MRLKVKSTVRPKSLWILAALVNSALDLHLTADMLVTSGNDSTHAEGSRHYEDAALDFRTKHLSPKDKYALIARLGERLGLDYDVLLEAEGTPNEHGHCEYDPT